MKKKNYSVVRFVSSIFHCRCSDLTEYLNLKRLLIKNVFFLIRREFLKEHMDLSPSFVVRHVALYV